MYTTALHRIFSKQGITLKHKEDLRFYLRKIEILFGNFGSQK